MAYLVCQAFPSRHGISERATAKRREFAAPRHETSPSMTTRYGYSGETGMDWLRQAHIPHGPCWRTGLPIPHWLRYFASIGA